MNNVQSIILAAGKSSRFLAKKSKLLHSCAGELIINRVISATINANINNCVVILGHQSKIVKNAITKRFNNFCKYSIQSECKGTGHAFWSGFEHFTDSDFLVLNGDMPLINEELIHSFLSFCNKNNVDAACVATNLVNPFGYGRIITTNEHISIVEEKELKPNEKQITLVNGGIYFFANHLKSELNTFVKTSLDSIMEKEIYITDFFNLIAKKFKCTFFLTEPQLVWGVNTLEQLKKAKKIFKK